MPKATGKPRNSTRKGEAPWNKGLRKQSRVNSDGYVEVQVPEGTPGRYNNGYILQHRLVMANILGRPLLPGETVHHLNGDRSDNREDNLELWVTPPRSGQRVEDLCDWAQDILRLYRPEALA